MSFIDELNRRAQQADSLLCIGLDPHPADLPSQTPQALRAFCLNLIEQTAPFAAAFKPNSAFFEVFGAEGIAVLLEVIAAVPEGIPVILDAKRGDIASTAQAYARAAFTSLGASAVTVNPYLGGDSLEPFLEDPHHGAFLLCKTSNPGAGDLQDLWVGMETLYETVARLAMGWNKNDNLGLVVGANQPEALRRVRTIAPGLWILAPGVGAQGGDLEQALAAGLRQDGLGMLVPVSRQVSRAVDPARVAQELCERINRCRNASLPQPQILPANLLPLAEGLLAAGCVRFGDFTLKSGLHSPIYLDLRQLVSYPKLLAQVAEAYLPLLDKLKFQRLAALPYAALPIATAISLKGGWPMIYPRKEAKDYGTRQEVEGLYTPGERVVVIDDLATTGGSKFEAIVKLQAAGLQVEDVVVLIERQSGAAEALQGEGYHLHSVFNLTQLLDTWQASGSVPLEQIASAREFIAKTGI